MTTLIETSLPGTSFPSVAIRPYDKTDIDTVHPWLSETHRNKWLDLGSGRQNLGKGETQILLHNVRHRAFLYGPSEENWVGLIVLSGIDHAMGVSEIWGLRGRAGGPRDTTVSAFLRLLATAFVDYNREVVSTWVVENNVLSRRLHTLIGMTETGRHRGWHVMDGKRWDRILYDYHKDEFLMRFPRVPAASGICGEERVQG